jgi:hypothetical protein
MRLERSTVLLLAASTLSLLFATLAVNYGDSMKSFWHLILSYFTFEASGVGVYFPSIGTLVLVLRYVVPIRFSWIRYHGIIWCSIEHLGRYYIFASARIQKDERFGRCYRRVALGLATVCMAWLDLTERRLETKRLASERFKTAIQKTKLWKSAAKRFVRVSDDKGLVLVVMRVAKKFDSKETILSVASCNVVPIFSVAAQNPFIISCTIIAITITTYYLHSFFASAAASLFSNIMRHSICLV